MKCCHISDELDQQCVSVDDGGLFGCEGEGAGDVPKPKETPNWALVCANEDEYTPAAGTMDFRGEKITCDAMLQSFLSGATTNNDVFTDGDDAGNFESIASPKKCALEEEKATQKLNHYARLCCGSGETFCGEAGEPKEEEEEPCICTREYSPVCGTPEGEKRPKTFSNECMAACENAFDVKRGECELDCFCTKEYKPHCCENKLGEKQTYPNKCMAKCDEATFVHTGECKEVAILSAAEESCKSFTDFKACATYEEECCVWGEKGRCMLAENCDEKEKAITDEKAKNGGCEIGFEWSDTYSECSDVDECAMDKKLCGSNTKCTNEQGGYSCECAIGAFRNSDFVCEVVRVKTVVKVEAAAALSGVSMEDFGTEEATAFKTALVRTIDGVSNPDEVTIISVVEKGTERVAVDQRVRGRRLSGASLQIDYELAVAVDESVGSDGGADAFVALQDSISDVSASEFAEALSDGSTAFEAIIVDELTVPDDYDADDVFDTDECASETDDCGPNTTCHDLVGGYDCSCNEGFTASEDESDVGACHPDAPVSEDDAEDKPLSPMKEEDGKDAASTPTKVHILFSVVAALFI
jgi:hypothetical protein